MRIKTILTPIFILSLNCLFSQVGIGTTTPNGALEIKSSTNGVLVSNVVLTSRNIEAPVVNPNGGAILVGTLVWNTATAGTSPNNVTPGFYYWDGSIWVAIAGDGGKNWTTTGNAGTTAGTNYIGTTDAIDFVTRTNSIEKMRVTSAGNVGINTPTPTATALLTINPNTNAIRSGIDMTMTNAASTAFAINVAAANANSRGYFYDNTSIANGVFFGAGALLSATNIVSGYMGYRNGSGLSYGIYGINGTNAAYATNANTWAAFLQGRTVISSESSPTSPIGTDLEVRNTTTGALAPATVSLRQTNSLTTIGNILANLNFGDAYVTSPQAQIQVLRDAAASSAADMPTAMTFSTTLDGTSTLSERMRITNTGNVGIGATPSASAMLEINAANRGLLIPNVALTARNTAGPITAPATSLLVYNTATAGVSPNNVFPGYYYWNGLAWIAFTGSGGNDWSINGNSGTGAANYLGTSDAVSLKIATNGAERMRVLTTTGQIVVNNTAAPFGSDRFSVYNTNATDYAINGYSTSTGVGVYGENTGSGLGVYGRSTGANGIGTYGTSTGANGAGLYGYATGAGGDGIYGEATQAARYGVWGVNNNATGGYGVRGSSSTGTSGIGVYGNSSGTSGFGVYGLQTQPARPGVFGINDNNTGYGVQGTSIGNSGFGVYGTANGTSGYGIYGTSSGATGNGVVGAGTGTTSYGVVGTSTGTNGIGVFGSETQPGRYGIFGINNNATGIGSAGSSSGTNGYGMLGISTGTNGVGVYGTATGATGNGVIGTNTNATGTGVIGSGNNAGPVYITGGSGAAFNGGQYGSVSWGTTSATGIGVAASGNNQAITTLGTTGAGGAFTGNQWAMTGVATITGAGNDGTDRGVLIGNYVSGGSTIDNVYVGARIANVNYKILGTGGGSVSTTMKTSQGERILFAPEATESWFFDMGEVELVNGKATVNLDPIFVETLSVSKPFKVFVQGGENTLGSIRITRNQSEKSFVVEDLGGNSNGIVQYSVYGIWKGKEDLRLPVLKEEDKPKQITIENNTISNKSVIEKTTTIQNKTIQPLENTVFKEDRNTTIITKVEPRSVEETSKTKGEIKQKTEVVEEIIVK